MTRGDGAEELDGVPLLGDGVTQGIMRIGDTVRRPVRPFTATIQAYLAHLQEAGFTGAPVPLGIDDEGREVLSYVEGDVPREPLPAEAAGEDVLTELARLVRRLHDASEGWAPPPGAVWGPSRSGPGVPPPADGDPELVSHRDYCPGNVVFRAGLPVALIDFDLARPTSRLYDIANALYWWAPLYAPEDRAPAFADADIPRRAAAFADAYRMSAGQRSELVPMARRMIHRFHLSTRAAAEQDPVFRRLWEDSGKDRLPRAEIWIERQGSAITRALAGS
jgi:aminoglycoside phosphotransferase (APT) family kinase protein